MEYKIAVSWVETGIIKIEGNSVEAALKIAEKTIDDMRLPDGEYLDESFQIDKETTKLLNFKKNLV